MYRACWCLNDGSLGFSDPTSYDEAYDKAENIFRVMPVQWVDVVSVEKMSEFIKSIATPSP